jgi:hypothetical protein
MDLKECASVTLPRPMETKNEALIEMRRGTNEQIYNTYTEEYATRRERLRETSVRKKRMA